MMSPRQIRSEVRRLWDRGSLLRAWLGVEPLTPWSVSLLPPGFEPQAHRVQELEAWKAAIEAGCRCAGVHGYRIEYQDPAHAVSGHPRLPQRVVFDTPMDLILYLDEGHALRDVTRLSREICSRHPALREWIETRPMQVLRFAAHWPEILAVLDRLQERGGGMLGDALQGAEDGGKGSAWGELLSELRSWTSRGSPGTDSPG